MKSAGNSYAGTSIIGIHTDGSVSLIKRNTVSMSRNYFVQMCRAYLCHVHSYSSGTCLRRPGVLLYFTISIHNQDTCWVDDGIHVLLATIRSYNKHIDNVNYAMCDMSGNGD